MSIQQSSTTVTPKMKSFILFIVSVLFATASACSVDKKKLWDCLVRKGDKDSDSILSVEEVRKLVVDNTYWYEKLIKSPDSSVRQLQSHCGLPLTYPQMLKTECFKHCGGLDGKRTIYNRLCRR